MCGRYADFLDAQEILDLFSIAWDAEDDRLLPPNFNVAPMQNVRVVRSSPEGNRLEVARWGLVPGWAKDPSIGPKMINARLETITEKPSFRTAFAKRRCIVPASGYYEWHTTAEGKTPYFIHPADQSPLAMAGLLEAWRASADSPWLITCAVVTTAAQGELAAIHDRQPVMMQREAWETWLDPHVEKHEALAAAAMPAPELAWHAVDKAVGNVRNNGPQLVEPVA